MLVEVTIESIRVSLISQARVVILKDVDSDRYLPIWIGQFEAEAIMVTLQEMEVARPLTHDLLKNVILAMGGHVEQVRVTELRDDVYYARIIVEANGQRYEIDSRPSDSLALAVRVRAPIFIDSAVMDKAAVHPEAEMTSEEAPAGPAAPSAADLGAFEDFVDSLDLDDLEDSGNLPSD
jgi:bifunctional DNase/RNase